MGRRTTAKGSGIRDGFTSRWPSHVGNFTSLLIECRRHFSGDMDRLLVFCIISDRSLSAIETPLNLRCIAECSGLPRETARRKLQDLAALGWVSRDERGNFSITGKAAEDLAPLTKIGIKYLARMKAILISEEEESRAKAA